MKLRKLSGAVAILLVCLILLVSVSYAWFAISRAPEITGIDTQIGANGSLAVALLSDNTYLNPGEIRVGVGDSLELQDVVGANETWGNVIDLTDSSYGLNRISMLPARLNVSAGEQNVVGRNMLSVAGYGFDGRFGNFSTDTVSTVFGDGAFIYSSDHQSYGVRGIGSLSGVTAQQSALAGARSLVQSYTYAAAGAAESVWTSNGAALFDICYRKYYLNLDNFNNSDIAVIRDTASRLMNAMSYVNLALRQSVVGYAAAAIDNDGDFKTLRDVVENTSIPLSMILEMLPAQLPSGFDQWIRTVEEDAYTMYGVMTACDRLRGDRYTWSIISPLMSKIMDQSEVFVGNDRLSDVKPGTRLPVDVILTLTPDAGVMAHVADYAGNYRALFAYTSSTSIETVTLSNVTPAYLTRISEVLEGLEPAAGNGEVTNQVINDVYGCAIDLAFQSNVPSDLLLQTMPALRVDNDSEGVDIQGGGSYMRFRSEDLSDEQIIRMMDAVRLAFVDNQNRVLAMAKPNTSNSTTGADGVTAPLYLYEYTVSPDGSLSMGERRKDDSAITALTEGYPTVVTVILWLDGDHVDNSLATTAGKSMEGALNLQFAGSAKLQSADVTIRPGPGN